MPIFMTTSMFTKISVKMRPSPMVTATEMDKKAAALENTEVPLYSSEAAFIERVNARFDGANDWADYSEGYAERKGQSNADLQVGGELRAAVTSPSAYSVGGDVLSFNGVDLDKFVWHQEGYAKRRGGLGGRVPARPMLVIDAEYEAEVFRIFDAWVGGIIAGTYTHGGGTVQARGASGRWGSKIGRI